MKKLFVIGLVLFVAGCVSTYKLKDTGQSSEMWNAYSVTSTERLNEDITGEVVVWTKYGPILEAILFWKPVEDDQLLPLASKVDDEQRQPFKADMTVSEIVELYREDTVGSGKIVISMTDPEPTNINGQEAYRVQSVLSDKNGYDFKNELVFAVIDEKLYMIELASAAVHYFDERKKAFDVVIQSIKL